MFGYAGHLLVGSAASHWRPGEGIYVPMSSCVCSSLVTVAQRGVNSAHRPQPCPVLSCTPRPSSSLQRGQQGTSLEFRSCRKSLRFGACAVSFTGSELEQVAQEAGEARRVQGGPPVASSRVVCGSSFPWFLIS